MKKLFDSSRVILCMGTGGVGKTTLSIALARLAARMGKKVLVFTIDPSKRLASGLGLENWDGERVEIQGDWSGSLYASMIKSKETFDQFVMEAGVTAGELKMILENKLYGQLSTAMVGAEEFTSLYALYKASLDPQYDLVILDTPPAQHTLEFVQAPQKIYQLFNGKAVEWFENLEKNKTGVLSFLQKGTLLALKAFEKIIGSGFLKEIENFFKVIASCKPYIKKVAAESQKILSLPTTSFVMVSIYDRSKISEMEEVVVDLRKKGFPVRKILMNKALVTEHLEDADLESVEGIQLRKYLKTLISEQSMLTQRVDYLSKKTGIGKVDIPYVSSQGDLVNEIEKQIL